MPSSFTEYPLSEEILSALEQLQYRTPTPVRVKVIPEILAGKRRISKIPNRKRKNCFFWNTAL